jgi:CheY-like chemotaxis protein
MPNGGVLTIRTESITISAKEAAAKTEARPGTFACFSISDTGTGMSEETISRIFEPFFTTKEPGKGTGLGLAAIYGIIQEHNGWIDVSSQPGSGSDFRIYLPLSTGGPVHDRPSEIARELSSAQGNGRRILAVEDDPMIRGLIETALQKAGYLVDCAASAEEAEHLFALHGGEIDLLISDVIMPGKNGAELAAQLKEKRPDLPVILCSGYAGDRIREADIEKSRFKLLHKPFLITDLLEAVHHALQST